MANRVFRVELIWTDDVDGKLAVYSAHHDFPDASRASAFMSSMAPAGEQLEPRIQLHEIARSDRLSIRLFELER